jgi:LPS sulfotransferase NodH
VKILVLSHTRSGSTTLCKWISNELDIELDETPYNKKIFNEIFEKTDIIRKIVIEEYLPSNDIINKFDKVICLTRENSIDTAISFIVANKTNIWHNEYVVSAEWISKHTFEITDISRRYDVMKNYLKKINGLHITYEEIYIKNNITHLLKYLDITDLHFLDMLNSNKKYRKDKNSPINYDKSKNFI